MKMERNARPDTDLRMIRFDCKLTQVLTKYEM